jgi:hypothetical protein
VKRCYMCGQSKSEALFSKNKAKPDGLASQCKACSSERDRARYAADQASVIRRSAEWAASNREKARLAKRKHESKNKALISARKLAHARANPWKVNAKASKYRAVRLRATPAWASAECTQMWFEVAAVLSRSGVQFEVDHIVPLQSDVVCGLHVEHNMQVLPLYLNRSKKNSLWPDMPEQPSLVGHQQTLMQMHLL